MDKPNKQQTVIEQIYNHVNRTKSSNSKCIGESQGVTTMRNTEVSNINKLKRAFVFARKGMASYGQVLALELTGVLGHNG
jgi:hypothetical protein